MAQIDAKAADFLAAGVFFPMEEAIKIFGFAPGEELALERSLVR